MQNGFHDKYFCKTEADRGRHPDAAGLRLANSAPPGYTGSMVRKSEPRPAGLRKKLPEGVKFQCQMGCTKCCAIPGVVYVGSWEVPAMAEHFGMTVEAFLEQRLRHHFADVYELNMSDDEPCMYLEEDGCAIYPVRPLQCRTSQPRSPKCSACKAVANSPKT